jgi:hypothetical protein
VPVPGPFPRRRGHLCVRTNVPFVLGSDPPVALADKASPSSPLQLRRAGPRRSVLPGTGARHSGLHTDRKLGATGALWSSALRDWDAMHTESLDLRMLDVVGGDTAASLDPYRCLG